MKVNTGLVIFKTKEQTINYYMLLIFAVSISVLFLLNLILIKSKTSTINSVKNDTHSVSFSIIIAAKNEIANISLLLDSLKKLNYPIDNYETIIVDDNSSDGTYELLKRKAIKNFNFSIYKISENGKTGKRKALALGIGYSKNPYILITDADCFPNTDWLQSYQQKFNEGFDVLFGPAPFIQDNNFVNHIACFENLRSSILSFSFANIGIPYTAAARNMGFTKNAFEKIGGYKNTFDTLSGDDDLLIREAVKAKLKIGTLSGEKSFVYSKSKKTIKEYLNQRARHTQTSFHYLFTHKLLLATWHLINLLFLFSPLLAILDLKFLILLPSKLSIDLFIVKMNEKKYGYKFKWYRTIYLQIIYELMLIVHFFNAKFRKVKWK